MTMHTRGFWAFVVDALLLAALLATVYVATSAGALPTGAPGTCRGLCAASIHLDSRSIPDA
jgi:hypothetical protein